MSEEILSCRSVHKGYHEADLEVSVLENLDFSISAGERVAILGRSGSGKSTLLHILAGLDDADSGSVWLKGVNLSEQDVAGRAALRNQYMGFVYQFHHLLPEFSAMENVAMPLLLGKSSIKWARTRTAEILAAVGLTERAHHKPHQLSGGERQRVALARALAANPAIILADEPTGNLDRENAENVMTLVDQLCEQEGAAFLIVTHDENLAATMDRQVRLVDGVIVSG